MNQTNPFQTVDPYNSINFYNFLQARVTEGKEKSSQNNQIFCPLVWPECPQDVQRTIHQADSGVGLSVRRGERRSPFLNHKSQTILKASLKIFRLIFE